MLLHSCGETLPEARDGVLVQAIPCDQKLVHMMQTSSGYMFLTRPMRPEESSEVYAYSGTFFRGTYLRMTESRCPQERPPTTSGQP